MPCQVSSRPFKKYKGKVVSRVNHSERITLCLALLRLQQVVIFKKQVITGAKCPAMWQANTYLY